MHIYIYEEQQSPGCFSEILQEPSASATQGHQAPTQPHAGEPEGFLLQQTRSLDHLFNSFLLLKTHIQPQHNSTATGRQTPAHPCPEVSEAPAGTQRDGTRATLGRATAELMPPAQTSATTAPDRQGTLGVPAPHMGSWSGRGGLGCFVQPPWQGWSCLVWGSSQGRGVQGGGGGGG